MFTGIVEAVGTVQQIRPEIRPAGGAISLRIAERALFAGITIGESVAVNGVCLTVTEGGAGSARFDVVPETVQRTNLSGLRPGAPVNLERALQPTGRLGGHFVQGHVDGVGFVKALQRSGEATMLVVQAPPEVTDYLVEKGSVAIDGVSLTVARLHADGFTVALIPHTLAVTTLGRRQAGDIVNLEADLIGKYVARFLARQARQAPPPQEGGLLRLLQDEGFAQ